MREWERVSGKIAQASDDDITRWRGQLTARLFGCGFEGDRHEFARLVSNAYMKFPQYREEMCHIFGVRSDADNARIGVRWSVRLGVAVLIVTIVSLVVQCLAAWAQCSHH